ncbi:MAG TPA: glycoside hydrolase family 3 N-terminal domain-containing protein, partial [Methylococcales bacterium]
MKKKGIYFFVIVVFCFCNWSSLMAKIESQATPVYKDPNKPVNERVEDLISKMTIDEKIGQLSSKFNYKNKPQPEDVLIGHIRNPATFCSEKGYLTASECAKVNNEVQKEFIEKSRLGIPAIVHDETLHGVCGCGYCTSYPQSIAMAATFDPDLYREVADAISDEVKVLGIRQALSPVLNISRDPRWGRVQETYGEDPYLSSAMGYQFVNTFEKKGVVATPKHFVATVGDGGRDSYAMYCSERQLRELYFPPFETCVKKAGVRSLMVAYNSLNGVPCHSDAWLIETILRSEWGFSGIVVTDYEGIGGTWGRFNVATSHKLGILESYKAGVDV